MQVCEVLKSKPSNQEGWLQWGYVDEAGDWIGLYGLKDSFNREESMYYLDAAGICEAVGQSGQPVPKESPSPALEALPTTSTVVPGTSTELPQSIPASDQFPWGLVLVGGLGVAIIALRRGRRLLSVDLKSSNSVTGKEQDYPNVFKGD